MVRNRRDTFAAGRYNRILKIPGKGPRERTVMHGDMPN